MTGKINKFCVLCFIFVCFLFSCSTMQIADKKNYNLKGVELYQKGAYPESFKYFTKTLESDPSNYKALYYRGLILWHENKINKSIDEFSKAVKVKPHRGKAYSMRGAAYIIKGDYKHAEKDLDKAVLLLPGFIYSYINRASLYVMTGRFSKGIKECDFVLKKEPHNAAMYQTKSIALFIKGMAVPAINTALKAVKYSPDWANPYFVLGGYFHEIHKFTDAEKFFKKAHLRDNNIVSEMGNILNSPVDPRVKQMHGRFIKLAGNYLSKKSPSQEDKLKLFLKLLQSTSRKKKK